MTGVARFVRYWFWAYLWLFGVMALIDWRLGQ